MKFIEPLMIALAGLGLAAASADSPQQLGTRGAAMKVYEPTSAQRSLQQVEEKQIDIDEILGIGCFSELATALVQDKGPVAMKDLMVGDKVLTARSEYQTVYSFGHYHPTKRAEFRQVRTQESVLELTGEHLVYLKDHSHPVRADSLVVGDALLGQDGMGQTITKIGTVQRQGLYTPLTKEGTVVVDGIMASSYISLQEGSNLLKMKNGWVLPFSQHDYIHTGLSPWRLLCLGVSTRYCTNYNEDGIPAFLAWSIDRSLWTTEQHTVVQALILTVFLVLFVPSLAAEQVFGPSLAPLAIFALAGLLVWRKKMDSRRKQKTF